MMPDPSQNTDYIAGRFFVVLFAVGALGLLGSIAWNIRTGIAHAKIRGEIVRATDPHGFWTNIALQVALVLVLAWLSYRFRRPARL